MSYIKREFNNIKCDHCGALLDEECWHDEPDSLEAVMLETGFIEQDGKHYCPDCYSIDDNDNIIIGD